MKTRSEKIQETEELVRQTVKQTAIGFVTWLIENYDYVPHDAWSPKTGEKIAYLTWDVYDIYINTKFHIS